MKSMIRWVGGKNDLCKILESQLPPKYYKSQIIPKYFEPFVGGGSFLLHLLTNQYDIQYIYISDINKDLILLYNIIRDYPENFINLFNMKLDDYKETDDKKKYYYDIRELYNNTDNLIEKAVIFIFLNKMCYNSLYRLNKYGQFNVSYNHKYVKNPDWMQEDNIYEISHSLQDAHILCSDYTTSLKFIDNNSFLYLDIPYENTWNYNTHNNNLINFEKYLNILCQKQSMFLLSSFENNFSINYPIWIYDINKYHAFDRKRKDEILIRNYEV